MRNTKQTLNVQRRTPNAERRTLNKKGESWQRASRTASLSNSSHGEFVSPRRPDRLTVLSYQLMGKRSTGPQREAQRSKVAVGR